MQMNKTFIFGVPGICAIAATKGIGILSCLPHLSKYELCVQTALKRSLMYQSHTRFRMLPASLIGRFMTGLIAVGLVVMALFFLAFALAVVGIGAAAVTGRLWWLRRKLRAQRDANVIEGSFSVESGQLPEHISARPVGSPPDAQK
ncbi:MAG: hypothetical protein ABIS45_06440 [Burkholderiales bacterium]